EDPPEPVDVLPVGHANVDDRPRPVPGLVAHELDVPVRDDVERAVEVPERRHPQRERLDLARDGAADGLDPDDVADAELVLEQDEEPRRVSRTRLCAPKPSATPATPAEVRSGASGTSSSPRTRRIPIAQMSTTKVADSACASVAARWRFSSWVRLGLPSSLRA